MWGEIIGAGAKIIGGLFGSKKSSNRINYKAMVRDAEAAGFNPLTALRNGGSAGYMQGGNPTSLSRVGDALGEAGNFLANFDPFADDKREMETRVVEAQLANLQADTANKIKFGAVPTRGATATSRPLGQSVVQTAVLDGQTYRGSGENGAIEDMWVVYRRPDGSYVRTPNPNLPDLDQLAVPPAAAAENYITRPVLSQLDKGGWMSRRELTPEEKAEASWWPSFKMKWD